MPVITNLSGEYLWRDGTTSSLAPPSDSLDRILAQPTQFVPVGQAAVSYDRIYETQPFVAGAINLLAGQVARLPLKAFETLISENEDGSEKRERRRDRNSPLARALRRPNPRRSAHALKRDIATDLWVNGNHLEEIIWTRGQMNLQRIPWRFVKPELNDAGDTILGWTIQRPNEDERWLSNHDVIHFSMGSTTSGIGLSPLEQLGTTVMFDRAAQAYQVATMRNQARVGVVVSIDPAAYKDADVRESVREEFYQRYAGPRNAGRPYVAAGVDIKTVPQQTLVEADLVKQRLISREEIAAVLGTPTLFLGDGGKATMNNVEQYHRQLYKTTLAPALDNITETFYAQVIDEHPQSVPNEESYVEFDVAAILSGDPLERARTYRELQAAGALTINETRDRENLPQFDADWANEPMLPTNNLQPASRAFEEPEPVPAALGGPLEDEDEDEDE